MNLLDPIDTGLRYSCGGQAFSVSDLMGPGLDVRGRGLRPMIVGARAVADTGDSVTFLGPVRPSGRIETNHWWSSKEGAWRTYGVETCRHPRAVLLPGLDAATWSLRGRHGSRSRRIQMWVQEWACASGQPPVGRISRPIVQVRPRSIVIIMSTVPLSGYPQSGRRLGTSRGGFSFVDCQGAPPASYVVRLPVRLGDRVLYDGGIFPPRERPGQRVARTAEP